MIWEPENALPILDIEETQLNSSFSITVTTDSIEPEVLELTSYKLTPTNPALLISFTGATLNGSLPDPSKLFPILEIKYLLNGVVGSCTSWDDLPSAAEDLISYKKDPGSPKTWTLEITGESDLTGEFSQNYEIVVKANYTGGCNLLVSNVNSRRRV